MNETNFDPTFAEGNFDDLNKAHGLDVKDGGNREEGVYPTHNSRVDNAGYLGYQLRKAQTPEDLVKASGPLTNLNPETGASELEDRTGSYSEVTNAFMSVVEQQQELIKLWETNKEVYLTLIDRSNTIGKLNINLSAARDEFNNRKLGVPQLKEIVAAGEARRIELWETNKEMYLTLIDRSDTIGKLNINLSAAQDDANRRELDVTQLDEIVAAGEAKRTELWEARKAERLSCIANSSTLNELNLIISFATDAVELGLLGVPQLKEIEAAGEAKRIELWETNKREHLKKIQDSTTFYSLNENFGKAKAAANRGHLGEPQLKEIENAYETKNRALLVAAAISG